MWQAYYSVTSLEEAAALLAEHGPSSRIIAGGTDLLLEIERGQRRGITTLIDITRVPGLADIRDTGTHLELGPMVLHNHLVANPLVRAYGLPLAQAAWEVGAPQIRNRATLAGNLITASPANDTITPLMAMDAEVDLLSVAGSRTVPLRDFYTGLRRTVMRPDEVLACVRFPKLNSSTRGVFLKLGLRRAQAISVVDAAVVLTLDTDTIAGAAIALGSVAPTIIRLPAVEDLLTGKALSPDLIREAALLAGTIPKPIDDIRGSAVYREEMIRVLVSRALRSIADGTYAERPPQDPPMLWGAHAGQADQALPAVVLHTQDIPIETTINGQRRRFTTGQHRTLLDFLRDDAGLPGTKEGCAEGECGACTVFLDGAAVMSCLVPAPRAHGAEILTIEGLQGQGGALHPVQQAFIERGAVQCGYCTPGFIMAGAKLIEEIRSPTEEQAQQSITGNLCRCTGYYQIVNALIDAARTENVKS